MANFLSRLAKKVKFWLFEEREDIYAENPKRKRIIHNASLIQSILALIGIGIMALVPLVMWLITLRDFVIVYLASTVVIGIVYFTIGSYAKRMNKKTEEEIRAG